MKSKEFDLSIKALTALPGISKKTAENICNYLLKQDGEYLSNLFSKLSDLKYKLRFCNICNNITDNKIHCDICNDTQRNQKELCIVSNFNDIAKIEKLEKFNGLYFNLLNEIDSKKRNVDDFDLIINQLVKMIDKNKTTNILIATNMTMNGEFTSFYLSSYLKKKYKNLAIYRLAIGLPINSLIDYIDLESLEFAIKNKTKL
ncbi:MAG: toprim domain-containing protein [Mycoplasmoidaceae bacterium]